jgi:hypothetical protein
MFRVDTYNTGISALTKNNIFTFFSLKILYMYYKQNKITHENVE